MRREAEAEYRTFKQNMSQRRMADIFSKRQSMFGSRVANTTLNVKQKRRLFDDDVLPKLELFITHTHKLNLGSPLRGKHIFLERQELRQYQHHQSAPKNYKQYQLMRKTKRVMHNPEIPSFRYEGIHAHTIVMCKSLRTETQQPTSPNKRTNDDHTDGSPQKADKKSSTEFQNTISGLKKQIRQKYEFPTSIPVQVKASENQRFFKRSLRNPEKKAPFFDSLQPWKVQDGI